MPRCGCVSDELPDRHFDEILWPPPNETALDLFDCSNFSPWPDLLYDFCNVSEGRKHLSPGMQEDEVVVARSCQRSLSPNPEYALLEACEPSCGFRFGKVAISPFVIFHACLGNERFPVCQRSYQVRQIVVGGALERIAD